MVKFPRVLQAAQWPNCDAAAQACLQAAVIEIRLICGASRDRVPAGHEVHARQQSSQ